MVVTKLDLLRIVDQIGEKALGCVALRKGVRRALLELRLYRYQRRAAARRERAIRRLDLAKRTQSGWRGLLLRLGVSVQPSGRHRVRRREAAVRRSASEADKAEAVRTDGELLRNEPNLLRRDRSTAESHLGGREVSFPEGSAAVLVAAHPVGVGDTQDARRFP